MLSFGTITPVAGAISAENLTLAWQTPLLGMGMVFAVLGLLWAVLGVFKLVFAGKTPKAEKAPAPAPKKAAPAPAQKQAAPAPAAPAVVTDDAQLIAVITAAVAAYMAEEGTEYTGGFRVVSFKRVRGTRTWNTK